MHVAENVCLDVPHRQFVWTIPKRLRIFFRFHRALLARLPALAWRSLLEVYRSLLGSDAAPGGILAIQTFGQLIHFHPHIHGLITDGAFTPAGNFLPLPPNLGHESFLRLWENNVFRLLLDEDKIEPAVVDQIRSWRHSGFGIDRSVRLEAGDRQAIQRLAEYMARSPFSLARLIRITPAGQVIYRAEKDRPLAFPEPGSGDLFGGVPRNYQIFKPVDFLAELTQHIPNKGEHLIRYCGHYSNKARGLRARQAAARTTCPSHPADQHAGGLPPPPAQPATPATPDRRRWAMLIQHIYQVDPLKCPCCGGAMKILSFIEARQGDVIRKILQHCGLWQDPPSRSPPSPSAAAPAAPAGPDDDMRCTCQPDGDYLDFMRRQDVDEVEPVWEP
jgi:hypothetical protein